MFKKHLIFKFGKILNKTQQKVVKWTLQHPQKLFSILNIFSNFQVFSFFSVFNNSQINILSVFSTFQRLQHLQHHLSLFSEFADGFHTTPAFSIFSQTFLLFKDYINIFLFKHYRCLKNSLSIGLNICWNLWLIISIKKSQIVDLDQYLFEPINKWRPNK